LKGFSQNVVRANSARLLFVEWLEGAHQKHHRNMFELVFLFDVLADLITVHIGHEDINQNDIWREPFQRRDRFPAVARAKHVDAFIRESKINNFLNRD